MGIGGGSTTSASSDAGADSDTSAELCSCVVPASGGCMCCGNSDAGAGERAADGFHTEGLVCCAPTCVPTDVACPVPLSPMTVNGDDVECSVIKLPDGDSVYCCEP